MPAGVGRLTAGFVEFEFDLPDALLASLIKICDGMSAASLTPQNVITIPEAQGVYQLLHNGKIVYIGKTDADAGLRRRLERHAWTIQHRLNLAPADVTFKAVRIFVFTAIDLEAQLIRHYSNVAPLLWNNSGFGSNDPGRNRDDTDLRPTGFDAKYPIDLDHDVHFSVETGTSASAVLTGLRAALPYTLRVEAEERNKRRSHAELVSTIVKTLPAAPRTTRSVLLAVLASLPPGWQATALAGRVILYRETKSYRFGSIIGRSPQANI